jgi:YD repeat-containing protein
MLRNVGPADGQPGLTLSWVYDPFGNRKTQTASGSPSAGAPPTQSWVYSTNNQSSTSTYDTSGVGFVTADVANQYAYDNEGRLCAVSHSNGISTIDTQYIYDAEGRRVAKGSFVDRQFRGQTGRSLCGNRWQFRGQAVS